MIEELKKNNYKYKKEYNILSKEKISYSHAMSSFIKQRIPKPKDEEKKVYDYLNAKYDRYKNEDRFDKEVWYNKDFKKINFVILSQDSLIDYINNNPWKAENSDLYCISNPFFYNENRINYMFFNLTYKKGFYVGGPTYDEAIIFKKIKGKWTFVERRTNNSLY